MKQPILRNTSLCTIVRDEMMNPAGGIIDFVESTIPYVGEAIIVDTGSIDGTKEALAKATHHYPNLKLFCSPWKGYADARNNSLELATKDYILVLDADERLTAQDFDRLNKFMQANPSQAYDLDFINVFPHGEVRSAGHNPRVFSRSLGCEYRIPKHTLNILEWLDIKDSIQRKEPRVAIKHFLPDHKAMEEKTWNWYYDVMSGPPSLTKNFAQWKAYNPLRENYR